MCGNRQYTRCEAPIRLELPDGQRLFFKPRPSTSQYCYGTGNPVDRGELDKAPALEVAYQRESIGDGAIRVNNRMVIDANVDSHNAAARAPTVAGGRMGGPSPLGPTPGGGGDPGGGGGTPPVKGSAGCAIGGLGSGDALVGLALLVGLLLRRRVRS